MKQFSLYVLIMVIAIFISCTPQAPVTIPASSSSPAPLSTQTPAPSSTAPPIPSKTAATALTPEPSNPAPKVPAKETAAPSPVPVKESVSPSPAEEPVSVPVIRGTVDPAIEVTVNQSDKTWTGTTIMADNHDLAKPRIIEVNMLGEVVWQYQVPAELREYTNPGFDVEPLPNGNVLLVLPRNGVYEVDRNGKAVWSYLDKKVSHDADRLPNGNTLVVYGAMDTMSDAQVKEINPQGQVVWMWYARDYFNKPPYTNISLEGWTHTNAASRLSNGNTIISLRNFYLIAEVDARGTVVRTIGEGMLNNQHDPEMLPNGNILMADHSEPQRAIELDPETNKIVWEFKIPRQLVRDANRLPNGNTLITGATTIVEVTADKQVVWQLNLKGLTLGKEEAAARGFYKAERIRRQ